MTLHNVTVQIPTAAPTSAAELFVERFADLSASVSPVPDAQDKYGNQLVELVVTIEASTLAVAALLVEERMVPWEYVAIAAMTTHEYDRRALAE